MAEQRCDPRAPALVAVAALAAGLAGPRSAGLALFAELAWLVAAGVEPRPLLKRLLPLLSGFAVLLLLLPWAPAAVLSVALRGLAVSVAVVGLGTLVSWTGLLAALQGGLPRAALAFLLILGGHLDAVSRQARRAWRGLLLRGAWERPARFPRSVTVLLAAVLGGALERADQVARALELRGFEGRLPSPPAWRVRHCELPHYLAATALLLLAACEVGPWSR